MQAASAEPGRNLKCEKPAGWGSKQSSVGAADTGVCGPMELTAAADRHEHPAAAVSASVFWAGVKSDSAKPPSDFAAIRLTAVTLVSRAVCRSFVSR